MSKSPSSSGPSIHELIASGAVGGGSIRSGGSVGISHGEGHDEEGNMIKGMLPTEGKSIDELINHGGISLAPEKHLGNLLPSEGPFSNNLDLSKAVNYLVTAEAQGDNIKLEQLTDKITPPTVASNEGKLGELSFRGSGARE